MTNVEKELGRLEREIEAIKATYARTGTTMPVITKAADFVTSQNTLEYTYTVAGRTVTVRSTGNERVVVTLATSRGSNTIAALEFTCDNPGAFPMVQRVNYSGGARWMITLSPATDGNGLWRATTLRVVVHSMVDGVLTVEGATS